MYTLDLPSASRYNLLSLDGSMCLHKSSASQERNVVFRTYKSVVGRLHQMPACSMPEQCSSCLCEPVFWLHHEVSLAGQSRWSPPKGEAESALSTDSTQPHAELCCPCLTAQSLLICNAVLSYRQPPIASLNYGRETVLFGARSLICPLKLHTGLLITRMLQCGLRGSLSPSHLTARLWIYSACAAQQAGDLGQSLFRESIYCKLSDPLMSSLRCCPASRDLG